MKKMLLLLALLFASQSWGAGPTFISSGAGVAGTGNLSIAYPASPQLNDRILLQVGVEATGGDAVTTPSGFSLLFFDTHTAGGFVNKQYIFCRDSDGTESGTLSVTISGTAIHAGRMYLFRSAAACASISESPGLSMNFSDSVNAVTITTTGNYRLAVAFVTLIAGNMNLVSFSGETGGDWISQASFASVIFPQEAIQLQTAGLPAIGTISGGTARSSSGTVNVNRSFAMLPDPVPPENTARTALQLSLLPFTHQQIFTSSGTWTLPSDVDVVFVRVQGSGGGGGGGGGAAAVGDDPGGGGAGGGSGQLVQDFVEVSGNVAVTINPPGTGGAGSAPSGGGLDGDPGADGGTASFGTALVAQGGKGGAGGNLVADAAGGAVIPTPTPGGSGTASDSLPVQFFAIRGERGLQGGRGARIGTSQQTAGASSALFVAGAVGVAGAPPALGTGAGGGASTEYGIGGAGGNGGNNTDFPGFPGQDGQDAGSGGGGGGGGATWSVGGLDAHGGDGGDGAAGRVEVYW